MALNRLANLDVDAVLRSAGDLGRALDRIAGIVAEAIAPAGGAAFLDCDSLEHSPRGTEGDIAAALAGCPAACDLGRRAVASGVPLQEMGPPALLAYTYLLKTGKLGPVADRQAEALRVMQRNAQQLGTLIENMLAAARITQGAARFRFEPVSLATLAAEAHGGRVWCESEPGEGAHFFVALPKARRAPLDDQPAAPCAQPAGPMVNGRCPVPGDE